jgi:hypothetical protein
MFIQNTVLQFIGILIGILIGQYISKILFRKFRVKSYDTLLEGFLDSNPSESKILESIILIQKSLSIYETEDVAKRNATDIIFIHLSELIHTDMLKAYGNLRFIKECNRLVEALWNKEYKETIIERIRNRFSKSNDD